LNVKTANLNLRITPSIKPGILCELCLDNDEVNIREFVENWNHTYSSETVTRECPNCGDEKTITKYEANQNERTFCGQKCYDDYRAKTVIEVECEVCQETKDITKYRYDNTINNFCSPKCHHEYMKKRVTITCSNCGVTKERPCSNVRENSDNYYCCPECYSESMSNEGIVNLTCSNCGDTFDRWKSEVTDPDNSFCGEECRYESMTCDDFNFDNYGRGFYEMKQKVRKRDDYACQICGRDKDDLGKHPSVHHIIPVRWFVESDKFRKRDAHYIENGVLLCPSHHSAVEYNKINLNHRIDSDLANELRFEKPD
jgi:hypothetical protein